MPLELALNPNLTNNIIIGDPISHSLSPELHNYAYTILGIDSTTQFHRLHVAPSQLGECIEFIKTYNIHGITVTIPHKVAILSFLDYIDPVAKRIGAVNTVIHKNGRLSGYNTDWPGTIMPIYNVLYEQDNQLKLEDRFLEGKTVALVGAGGAARAMAFGVVEKGASLVIINRTLSKAQELQNHLKQHFDNNVQIASSAEEINWGDIDIVINATSLGMKPNTNISPLDSSYFHKNLIVFDAVYTPRTTRLIKEAEDYGCAAIAGLEMFLYQAIPQFEYYTNKQAPADKMRTFLDTLLP